MVLLTGATGFTGQRLLPRLRERTESVRVFVRPTSDLSTVDLRGLDVVVGDLTDRNAVRTALIGVQRVLHLAHIRYAPQLLEYAPTALEHLVALSSLRLLSTIPAPSVDEVVRAEQEVGNFETPCTILRPSMIFGRGDRNINRMATQLRRFHWVPVFGNGRALSQPVYVDDVVTAALICLERPDTAGKTYALAGPTPLSLNDIVEAFGKTTQDYALLVCYFASDGSQAATEAFVGAIADTIDGELPPLTLVPQPKMHSDDITVEIWGVARG